MSIYAIGQVASNLTLLVVAVFVAGATMNTAQSSMTALAAGFYPTQGCATGASWMRGIGRLGGVAGTFLVAELSRRQLGFPTIFMLLAVQAVIAAVTMLVKQLVHPEERFIAGAVIR